MRRYLFALAVFAVSLGYFALFRNYGFQFEDEGTLLFQLDRASRGQLPYTDFGTGYTPGFFAAGAALLRAVEYDTASLRTALACLNAAAASFLFLIADRVAGRAAILAPLAWVLFLPVFAGGFASFNIPYPAWLANMAWLAVALALMNWARTPSSLWLAATGAAAAAAFAVKPNAGAFAMAGAIWALAPFLRVRGGVDRACVGAAILAMVAGVWVAFEGALWGWDFILFLLPCWLLAVGAWVNLGRFADQGAPGPFAALTSLALGFSVPTLFWLVPTFQRLGLDLFLREVLFVGSGAADLFKISYPRPEFFASVLCLGTVVFALLSWFVKLGKLAPQWVFAAFGLGGAVVAWKLIFHSMAPEGLRFSVLAQFENAAMLVAPLVHLVAGIGLLQLGRDKRGASWSSCEEGERRNLVILSVLAAAMYLQVWPRVDFMHFALACPLSLALTAALGRQIGSWWRHVDESNRWAPRGLAVVAQVTLLLTVWAKLSLVIPGVLEARAAALLVDTPRLAFAVEADAADAHRSFGKTLEFLQRVTRGDEPVLAFPAAAAALYALGLTSPVPHDYWYPGRPDKAEEATMLSGLQREPPRVVVTLNDRWAFFPDAPAYFRASADFASRHYRLAARYGRFDVLLRKDVEALAMDTWQPTGPLDEVFQPKLLARQQAATRWVAGLQPADALAAELPGDRTRARLLLRALRDVADLRAAAWLIEGVQSPDPLLRDEALRSMRQTARAFEGVRFRWAADYQASQWRPWVEHLKPWAERASVSPFLDAAWFASTLLFVIDGAPEPERPSLWAVRAPDAE